MSWREEGLASQRMTEPSASLVPPVRTFRNVLDQRDSTVIGEARTAFQTDWISKTGYGIVPRSGKDSGSVC
jgi:hypothetical protein